MDFEVVYLPKKKVSGVGFRTTNAENKFGEAWQGFLGGEVNNIKNRSNGNLLALYTDYESDNSGEFYFLVGAEVSSNDGNGNCKIIPAGKFAKYTIASRDEIFGFWQYIWGSDIKRSFTSDYEEYKPDGSVDIYIALRDSVAPCGTDCEECHSFNKECSGCEKLKGEVYWAQYVGAKTCPKYDCCVNGLKLNHCGECEKAPCNKYFENKDPSMTDAQHREGIENGIKILKSRM